MVTAEKVLELLSDDFDGEESDFSDDQLYSYNPRLSTDGLNAGLRQRSRR